jgi:hypothetical protein
MSVIILGADGEDCYQSIAELAILLTLIIRAVRKL